MIRREKAPIAQRGLGERDRELGKRCRDAERPERERQGLGKEMQRGLRERCREV